MLSEKRIDSEAEEAFLAECREKDKFLDSPGVRTEKAKGSKKKKKEDEEEEERGDKHLTLEQEVNAVYSDYTEGRPTPRCSYLYLSL